MDIEKQVDCQLFQNQLDALVRGELSEEGMRQLRLHSEECAECGVQLKVQEHLVGPSLAELESQVPEEMLALVWAGIQKEVKSRGDASSKAIRGLPARSAARRPPVRWLVPTLAAATLILVFSTGFLALELGQLRDREASLTQQITEQQGWLAELDLSASTDPVARTAALAGRTPFARALSRQENISISGLKLLLHRMPGNRIVLTQAQVDAALRSRIPLTPPFMREALAGLDGQGGVQARELLQALESLDVNPDVTVPTAELVALLS